MGYLRFDQKWPIETQTGFWVLDIIMPYASLYCIHLCQFSVTHYILARMAMLSPIFVQTHEWLCQWSKIERILASMDPTGTHNIIKTKPSTTTVYLFHARYYRKDDCVTGECLQDLDSLSSKASFCKISQRLKAANSGVEIIILLWYLAGTSEALVLKHLWNFKMIWKV